MTIGRLLVGAAAAAAMLSACATVPRYRAADDVHALLVSIRDGDRTRFEAHVDRPALKIQLRARVIAQAAGGRWGALGAALAGPLVDFGVDALVRPEVFRAEAVRLGYDPNTPLPGTLRIAALIKPLGDGRACVQEYRGGPCVLSFNDQGGVWRLTGYEGPLDRLGLPKVR